MDEENAMAEEKRSITESGTIELNGQRLTESEFNKQKKVLEEKPGVKVIEVSSGVYKTRIQG